MHDVPCHAGCIHHLHISFAHTTQILCCRAQYRNDAQYGFWRKFNEHNVSHALKGLYMAETAVHEMFLQVSRLL